MPTLECLDERSVLILRRLEEIKTDLEVRGEKLDKQLIALEQRVSKIELDLAGENGKKSVLVWVGGVVFALLGAIANMIWVWLAGPKGPLSH